MNYVISLWNYVWWRCKINALKLQNKVKEKLLQTIQRLPDCSSVYYIIIYNQDNNRNCSPVLNKLKLY